MNETSGQNLSIGLEVEGESGVWWCARHKSVKTRLRCGRCEKPICPKCTVYGPTGARCSDCASYKGTHLYQVAPAQYALAAAVAVVLGSLSGLIVSFIGLFALFYAPVAGRIMAQAIGRVTGNKRGVALAVIASAGLVLGAMIPQLGVLRALWMAARAPGGVGLTELAPLLFSNASSPFVWIYLVLAIPSVWWWIK